VGGYEINCLAAIFLFPTPLFFSVQIQKDTMESILNHSMPEILNPGDGVKKQGDQGGSEMVEYNYTYRVRAQPADDVSAAEGDSFFNCFVAFRELSVPSTKTLKRQSIVLVSRWPFPHFAFRLLAKIEEALWHVFNLGSSDPPAAAADTPPPAISAASQALHTAYGQFQCWPAPAAGTPLAMPFFGEVSFIDL
jgi:hypothetical protein